MYFATSAARQLSLAPALPEAASSPLVHVAANARKTLFCTLSDDSVSVWRIRPTVVLAHLSRTKVSLDTHGHNLMAHWAPDGNRIVIQTTTSHLVLITVLYPNSAYPPYSNHSLPNSSQRHFLPGPGEGHLLPSVSLRFEGVVRIEGDLLCISPRQTHVMFSTETPAAIQRIPWPSEVSKPSSTHPDEEQDQATNKWIGHDTWFTNHSDLPWLVQKHGEHPSWPFMVTVQHISHSRTIAAEVWITSDGRAYFVQLYRVEDDEPDSEGSNIPGTVTTSVATSEKASSASESSRRPSHQADEFDFQRPDGTPAFARQDVVWEGTCIHGALTDSAEQTTAPASSADRTPRPTVANDLASSIREQNHDEEDSNRDTNPDQSLPLTEASSSESDASSDAGDVPPLDEQLHATCATLNHKFSIIAVGTKGGTIHLHPVPLSPASPPIPSSYTQVLSLPDHWTQTGPVQVMEWTSDG
ncbi:hypothetical protein FRB99_002244, partial [Tulasnella sp. 403]